MSLRCIVGSAGMAPRRTGQQLSSTTLLRWSCFLGASDLPVGLGFRAAKGRVQQSGPIACPQLFWLPHYQPNRHTKQAFVDFRVLCFLGLLGLHSHMPLCRIPKS